MSHQVSTRMPDLTGQFLDGRYQFIRRIGIGGYGVVYEASDMQASVNGRSPSFAVKVIMKSPHRLSSFTHPPSEITYHQRASSVPNVVRLRDTLMDGNFYFLVMDLCAGGSLGQYLTEKGPMTDEKRVRAIFLGVVDAVLGLRQLGIYHRDLKPGNILLNQDNTQVFLADFGMASHDEFFDRKCGTKSYMPPELLRFDAFNQNSQPPPSAHSETWALAILLINILTGRQAWDKACITSTRYVQYLQNPGYLVERFRISPSLNIILGQMLHPDPAQRMELTEVRRAIAELDTFLISRKIRIPIPSKRRFNFAKPAGVARPVEQANQNQNNNLALLAGAQSPQSSPTEVNKKQGMSGPGQQGACNTSWRTSKSNTSSRTSQSNTLVATPQDSDVTAGKMQIKSKMGSIMSRVRTKFGIS